MYDTVRMPIAPRVPRVSMLGLRTRAARDDLVR